MYYREAAIPPPWKLEISTVDTTTKRRPGQMIFNIVVIELTSKERENTNQKKK